MAVPFILDYGLSISHCLHLSNLYYCLKLHLPVKVFSCLHFCTCMTLHTDQQSAKRSSQETNLSLTVERANWHIQPKSFMIMKQTEVETDTVIGKPKQATPPPPPPPPPLPRFWARKTTADSVTNQEIARFWRQKRVEEEDHLLAAIKAAARIRARNLPEEDYKRFEESLNDEDNNPKEKITAPTNNSEGDEKNNEIRVGIKDWWTKSKYAYLNQPAVESMDNPKRRASTYIPKFFNFKPAPLYPTSLGVF